MRTIRKRISILLISFMASVTNLYGVEDFVSHPLEPADTRSPRATLKSFLDSFHEAYDTVQKHGMHRGALSVNERDFHRNRVFGCLDLSEVPPTLRLSQAEESAAYLKEVLDRVELPPESDWPDETMASESDGENWTIPHTEITIAKVRDGPKAGQYLFTPETVARAAEFYNRVSQLPYQDRPTVTPNVIQFFIAEPGWMLPRAWIKALPAWAHHRLGGQAIWQWAGLTIALLALLLLMLVVYVLGIRRSRSAGSSGVFRYMLSLAFPIVGMLVPLLGKSVVLDQLQITGNVLVGVTYFLDLILLFTLVVVVLGAFNRLAALLIAPPWVKPKGLDAQLVRLACRMAGITAAAVVVLEGGQLIGIPLTTLLAGAGVSGLALALAAQDTLKNVFGSIMISLDKPYRVGERIIVKGYDGVVEEVGLRSTKIRLLTGHLTTIPNEDMARSDIENIGRRPHIRRISDIPIPLNTPPEKIERAVNIVREVLDDHEGMESDFPPRVYFNDFNRDSFNIRMILWFHPAAYWDFLAFSQDINQRIVEAFETDGIQFAPPTNVTYVSQPEDQPLRLDVQENREQNAPTPPKRS